jgi:DNA-binding MarR family transcriptional regulator
VQEKQRPDAGGAETDHVDQVRRQWARVWPDLDTDPIGVIARIGRAQAYIDPALDAVFAEHGLTRGSWDVLAALRRVGEPYRLTPTELYRALMRTSGAITHTLHRLEYAGLVERLLNPEDGRSLYVALTPRGVEVTDTVAPLHLDNERRLLAGLTPDEQHTLANLLRKLLLGFQHDQPAPAPRPARRATGRHSPRQG